VLIRAHLIFVNRCNFTVYSWTKTSPYRTRNCCSTVYFGITRCVHYIHYTSVRYCAMWLVIYIYIYILYSGVDGWFILSRRLAVLIVVQSLLILVCTRDPASLSLMMFSRFPSKYANPASTAMLRCSIHHLSSSYSPRAAFCTSGCPSHCRHFDITAVPLVYTPLVETVTPVDSQSSL